MSTIPTFPPRPEERWTLDTWRDPPLNRRPYQRMREIVPTARVASTDGSTALRHGQALDVGRVVVGHPDGRGETASAVLDRIGPFRGSTAFLPSMRRASHCDRGARP